MHKKDKRFAGLKLDRRVELQKLTQNQGSEGGQKDNWAKLRTVWAQINNLSNGTRRSEEPLTSKGGVAAEAVTEFTIRYFIGMNAEKFRIVYNGQFYNIKHVNDYYERHEWLILTCETGRNLGR